jgi:tetratricopeptide (TPR) repeat protein
MDEGEDEEYLIRSKEYKAQGDAALQAGDCDNAIKHYTAAIELDPDNHVLYSNRSAAYMKIQYISKALRDAEKCVALAPTWVKGYNRLGVAQQSLNRYKDAINTYENGLKIDGNDESLWILLRKCQELLLIETKKKEEEERIQQEKDEELRKKQEELKKKQEEETSTANVTANSEDDLLAGFFGEITQTVEVKKQKELKEKELKEKFIDNYQNKVSNETESSHKILTSKYTEQDLGNGNEQVERLTGRHHEWKNLNPYYVLQLGTDATEEDITYRYRKLSAKVHPDKLLSNEKAREAFEQVKKAYAKLSDENQRKVVVLNIENVQLEVKQDRHRRGLKDTDAPDLHDEVNKAVMKSFADMEMERRRAEINIQKNETFVKMKEVEEAEKLVKVSEYNKEWVEDDRVEKRIGSWREFQNGDNKMLTKKLKTTHKQEVSSSKRSVASVMPANRSHLEE